MSEFGFARFKDFLDDNIEIFINLKNPLIWRIQIQTESRTLKNKKVPNHAKQREIGDFCLYLSNTPARFQ